MKILPIPQLTQANQKAMLVTDIELQEAQLARLVGFAGDPVGFARWLGVEPTPQQEEIALSVRDNPETNVQAAHGVGKCVASGAKMLLASGLEVSASALVGREFRLLTLVNGTLAAVVAYGAWNQLESVYEIETETGRRIVRNGQHPLFAAIKWSKDGCHPIVDSKGWTSVEQMQEWMSSPPDYLPSKFTAKDWSVKETGRRHVLLCAVPAEIPVFGDRIMPEHEIKLIAYLIGDGGLSGNSVTFSQSDNTQLKEFRDCVVQMGCVLQPIPGDKYTYVVRNPVDQRHSKRLFNGNTPGLFENGDFSCEHHISTRRLRLELGHNDNLFYPRINALGIKPVSFGGRSYISVRANMTSITCLNNVSRFLRLKFNGIARVILKEH